MHFFCTEMMLQQQTAASETAAVVLEPVLGEGGYVPPAPGLLPEAESMNFKPRYFKNCRDI